MGYCEYQNELHKGGSSFHCLILLVSSLTSFPKDDLTPVAGEMFTDNGFPSAFGIMNSNDSGKNESLKTPTAEE